MVGPTANYSVCAEQTKVPQITSKVPVSGRKLQMYGNPNYRASSCCDMWWAWYQLANETTWNEELGVATQFCSNSVLSHAQQHVVHHNVCMLQVVCITILRFNVNALSSRVSRTSTLKKLLAHFPLIRADGGGKTSMGRDECRFCLSLLWRAWIQELWSMFFDLQLDRV